MVCKESSHCSTGKAISRICRPTTQGGIWAYQSATRPPRWAETGWIRRKAWGMQKREWSSSSTRSCQRCTYSFCIINRLYWSPDCTNTGWWPVVSISFGCRLILSHVTESFCMFYSTNDVQDHVNSDADVKLPFAIQFDRELKDIELWWKPSSATEFNFFLLDINSSFIKLSVYISTANVASHLRPLTTLFLDALFTLPIETEDGLIPYEEVVKRLSEDTVDYYASLGTSVGFREVAMLGIKVEVRELYQYFVWSVVVSIRVIAHSNVLHAGCEIWKGCSMD